MWSRVPVYTSRARRSLTYVDVTDTVSGPKQPQFKTQHARNMKKEQWTIVAHRCPGRDYVVFIYYRYFIALLVFFSLPYLLFQERKRWIVVQRTMAAAITNVDTVPPDQFVHVTTDSAFCRTRSPAKVQRTRAGPDLAGRMPGARLTLGKEGVTRWKTIKAELDMGPFLLTQFNPFRVFTTFGQCSPIHKYLALNRTRKLCAPSYSNADFESW